MKTMLVSDIFPPKTGGSGRWFWEIYRRMPTDQIVIAAGETPSAADFDRGQEMVIHRLPLEMRTRAVRSVAGLRGYAGGVWRLRRVILREGVMQVHAARCLPEGLMALALKWLCGTPYLCYAHGEELGTASTSRELTWLTSRVLKGCMFVVANSHNTRGILLRNWGMPEERVQVLHPGVDTHHFSPATLDKEFLSQMGWGTRTVLLTVGRLQKRKGHDMMIRALEVVRRRVPNVLYAIVGAGEERQPLENLARAMGVETSVQFLGEPDDDLLVQCYRHCDLFVLPNRAIGKDIEGFGMVLLEAQACGKAVLAGASGGTAETMRVPETGEVVNCDAPNPLAEAVCKMLSDPAGLADRGRQARQWVCDHFDWDNLARQATKILFRGSGT